MPVSELRLIKKFAEHRPRKEIPLIPHNTRGLYVLLHHRQKSQLFDVLYVGMAGGTKAGIGGRLRAHARSRRKGKLWTHFSIFEVWENVREEDVKELEGLFRHIYRKDTRANLLNRQRSFKKLKKVRNNNFKKWNNS